MVTCICVAIAAVHGDLPRMSQLLSRGSISMYLYWPWNMIINYNIETPEEEIRGQMKQIPASVQDCDHLILENLNEDEFQTYNVFQSHCAFHYYPLLQFLHRYCSRESFLQYIRTIECAYLELCAFKNPIVKIYCEELNQ